MIRRHSHTNSVRGVIHYNAHLDISTYEKYLKEMKSKYAPGTKIRSDAYPALDGHTIEGKQILEIPESNKNFSEIQSYVDIAKNKYNIEIRFRPE